MPELTPGQRKVLYLLANGLSDKVIAHHIGTSVRTARRHVKEILTELNVDTRMAAGGAAAKRGWVFGGQATMPELTPVGRDVLDLMTSALPDQVIVRYAELTPVGRRVLYLMMSGLSDKVIAHHIGTSVRTVRRHVKEILTELNVDTRFAAGAAAVRRGWV
ncbi:MAG: LuxR C-terminal-related transcriptional regulator [Labedaea sp.]